MDNTGKLTFIELFCHYNKKKYLCKRINILLSKTTNISLAKQMMILA